MSTISLYQCSFSLPLYYELLSSPPWQHLSHITIAKLDITKVSELTLFCT